MLPELDTAEVEPSQLNAYQRSLVAETWQFRAHAERLASMRFERLANTLRLHGTSEGLVTLAESSVQDEVRHAALCDALVARYTDGDIGTSYTLPAPPPLAPPGLDAEQRLCFEMMAFCCLTESINAAMLMVVLKATREPRIRSTIRTILGDEVKHSRLGWGFLTESRQHQPLSWLGETLPFMLKTAEVEEIFDADDRRQDPVLQAFGELTRAQRVAIFQGAIIDIVLPGLERLDIPTERARTWLRQRDMVGVG